MFKKFLLIAGLTAAAAGLAAALVLAAAAQTTATVSGTITQGGNPVNGVNVVVKWDSGFSEIVTGPDGGYSAGGIPVGERTLVNVRPPLSMRLEYRTWFTATLAGDASKDFDLAEGYLLSGRIVEPDGTALYGDLPVLDGLGVILPAGELYAMDIDTGGYFTCVLQANFYTLYFMREMIKDHYMPPTVIDLRSGDETGRLITLLERPVVLPMEPPIASLISVSEPDEEGYAVVHGEPGSLPPLSAVLVDNLNAGAVAATASDASGAFTTRLYAPPGSWIMVKYDPSGERVSIVWAWSQTSDKETAMDFHNPPGTLIYVGDKPQSGNGWQDFDEVGKIGNWAAWWMSGTLQTENSNASPGVGLPVVAGETFSVSASLLVTSPAMDCTGVPTYTISGTGVLTYLFDGNGRALQSGRWFTSFLFTPTGLPIEHEADLPVEVLEDHIFTDLTCVSPHALLAHLEQTYTIPIGLREGIFRPGLLVVGTIPQQKGYPNLVSWLHNAEMAMLPLLRVGETATPHIPWTLLSNYTLNGLRGLQAQQDKGRYAMPDRLRIAPDLVVVPRLDERSGQALVYRLEPGSMWLSGSDRRPPPVPRLPLDLQSGELLIEVIKPGGGVDSLGPAQIQQSWLYTPGLLDNNQIHEGTGHITDVFHLYRPDTTWAYSFQEDGFHTIQMTGSIADIYGNVYPIEGTYELLVAHVLDLDAAQLGMMPYETGDSFAPGLHIYPPLSAQVDINLLHLPDSDPAQAQHYSASGQANRFGYFQPAPGAWFTFENPGEFRVDIQAIYHAPDGSLWAGTTTWGSVVASPQARFEVHGRRGMDYKQVAIDPLMPAWFTNANLDPAWVGIENYYPYFSGDILWGAEVPDLPKGGDSLHTILTIKDLTPGQEIYNLLRSYFPRATNGYRNPPTRIDATGLEQRIAIGEAPLFISTNTGEEAVIDPGQVEFWSYWYGCSERPDLHVREIISEDGMGTAYWRYGDTYGMQIGEPADGDQPGDIKWNFGGAVLRVISETLPINEYNIYGSFWVLLPHDDPVGPRVTPPFQTAAGGINGGPIMTLLGQEIDMLFLPKCVRPGDILQVDETVAFCGNVGPPLDSRVEVTITSPQGDLHSAVWRANKIGWIYDPGFDFLVDQIGVWTVDVFVEHDRPYLPTGITPTTHNTGSVLGTNGRYEFYVVGPDSPWLFIAAPKAGPIYWSDHQVQPITIRGVAPPETSQVHFTIHDKGMVMGQGTLSVATDGQFSLVYDAVTLQQSFPMLSLTAHEGRWQGLADEVEINFLAIGPGFAQAASLTLISEQIYLGSPPRWVYLPLVRH